MTVQLTGFIRGLHSTVKAEETTAVTIKGNSLQETLGQLVLSEWVFVLRVNGRRILEPAKYLKRKKLDYLYQR